MTRIIIILICALGIAYYTVQIYSLKDTISLTRSAPETKSSAKTVAKQTAQPKMQFQFTMESTDVDLIEGCRQLFRDDDKLQLQVDPKQTNKAILKAERNFDAKDLEVTLKFRRSLLDKGCLQKDSDVFAIKVVG
jgi:hypothetical protein|nr:hypothetical protein [uncultured Undibacterium sp.]